VRDGVQAFLKDAINPGPGGRPLYPPRTSIGRSPGLRDRAGLWRDGCTGPSSIARDRESLRGPPPSRPVQTGIHRTLTIRERRWKIASQAKDVGSGAKERPGREGLLKAARRREVDVVVVWRLDRRGRSLPDLVVTLRELTELGVGFVSLTKALDLTTPTGPAMTGMLAVFAEFEREILRERVRAGIAQARREGRPHGRPRTASLKVDQVLRLKAERVSHSEIARRLGIGRTSVRRIVAAG